MTVKFFKEGLQSEAFDMGITELGSDNRIRIELFNNYDDKIQLTEPTTTDPDVKIVEFSEEIDFQGKGFVIIEFSPKKERKESLKESPIGFKVIIG